MGPIADIGGTETMRRETKRLQSHFGETEIPIGEAEKARVYGSGYCHLYSVAPDRKNRWGRV